MHSNVPLISVYQMIYPLPSPTRPNLHQHTLQPTFGLAHAPHAPQCTLAVPTPPQPQHIPTHDDTPGAPMTPGSPPRSTIGTTWTMSPPSHSHMMGSMSSQAQATRQCASGMLRQARPSPVRSRGTRMVSDPLHSCMMGGVSSLARTTIPSGSGTLRQARPCWVPLREREREIN